MSGDELEARLLGKHRADALPARGSVSGDELEARLPGKHRAVFVCQIHASMIFQTNSGWLNCYGILHNYA